MPTELIELLTPKQIQIVWAVINNKTYKDAAEALGIPEQTVKNNLVEIRQVVHALNNENLVWLLREKLETKFGTGQTEYRINDPNASWNLPK